MSILAVKQYVGVLGLRDCPGGDGVDSSRRPPSVARERGSHQVKCKVLEGNPLLPLLLEWRNARGADSHHPPNRNERPVLSGR